MTRATLLALAERVEAATRGSDELDAHIRCALFGKPNNFVKQSHINGAWCVWRIDGAGREVAWDGNGLTQLQRLGAFTASLDAAMSLVDLVEGIGKPGHAYFPNICRATRDLGDSAYWLVSISHCFDRYRGEASTLALALTASALRAIAGSMTDDAA